MLFRHTEVTSEPLRAPLKDLRLSDVTLARSTVASVMRKLVAHALREN